MISTCTHIGSGIVVVVVSLNTKNYEVVILSRHARLAPAAGTCRCRESWHLSLFQLACETFERHPWNSLKFLEIPWILQHISMSQHPEVKTENLISNQHAGAQRRDGCLCVRFVSSPWAWSSKLRRIRIWRFWEDGFQRRLKISCFIRVYKRALMCSV